MLRLLVALVREAVTVLQYRIRRHTHPESLWACPYCGAKEGEDCSYRCPMRACPECAGLELVPDYEIRLGVDERGNPLFGGKLCPRCHPGERIVVDGTSFRGFDG